MFKKQYVVNFQNKVMNFNPPKSICNHLLGDNHTLSHRMVTGFIMIVAGVYIAELGSGLLQFTCSCFGYFVHAVGSMPFIEVMEKWRKSE